MFSCPEFKYRHTPHPAPVLAVGAPSDLVAQAENEKKYGEALERHSKAAEVHCHEYFSHRDSLQMAVRRKTSEMIG